MDDSVAILILVVLSGAPIAGLIIALVAMTQVGGLRRRCRELEGRMDMREPPPPPPVEPQRIVEGPTPGPISSEASGEGGEPKVVPKPPSEGLRRFESLVGKRWITWAGALAMFVGAAFFVKYAIDRGWIGPEARVLCGGVVGLTMIGVGVRFLLRKMRALGQGLIGGGLAIVYVSIYAAHGFYELIPLPVALGLLAVAAAGGMGLAVLHRALPVSLLAALGGFLAPLILWTGLEERDTLFTYLAVLDLGVLGVALHRRWRSLDAMAQGATLTYFAVWYLEGPSHDPVATALWLGGFYLLFAVVPYARHLVERTAMAGERVAMAVFGTGATIVLAADLLYDRFPLQFGAFASSVAVVLLAMAEGFKRRVPEDRRGLFVLVALTVCAVTASLPGFLELRWLTVGLAAEGVALLWLAWRFDYLPVRVAAALPIAISAARVFAEHWPLHGYGDVYTPIFNWEFLAAIAFVLASFAYAGVQHAHRARATAWDRILLHATAHGGAFFGMGLVSAELFGWLESTGERHLAHALLPLPWVGGALAYLLWRARERSTLVRAHGLAALIVAGAISAWVYAFGDRPPSTDWLIVNWRFSAALAGVAVLAGFAARRLRSPAGQGSIRIGGAVLMGCVLCGSLTLLSAEVWQFFAERAPHPIAGERAAQTALTILWSVFAAGVLAAGIWLAVRPLRFAALALLGVTAVKLVMFDLAVLRDAYRIVAFVALGLVLLGASYLYHKLERRLALASGPRQGG
jgi:uncharacterized membrane protein